SRRPRNPGARPRPIQSLWSWPTRGRRNTATPTLTRGGPEIGPPCSRDARTEASFGDVDARGQRSVREHVVSVRKGSRPSVLTSADDGAVDDETAPPSLRS